MYNSAEIILLSRWKRIPLDLLFLAPYCAQKFGIIQQEALTFFNLKSVCNSDSWNCALEKLDQWLQKVGCELTTYLQLQAYAHLGILVGLLFFFFPFFFLPHNCK